MTPEDKMKKLGSAEASGPTEAEWLEFRQKAHESVTRRRIAAIAGGTTLLLAVVGGAFAMTRTSNDAPRPDVVNPGPTDTETPTPGPSETEQEKQERVFVQHWYVEKDGTLLLTRWPLEESESLEKAALESLVSFIPGPLGETGARTAIPDGTEVSNFAIMDDTAYVALLVDDPTFDPSFSSKEEQDLAHAQVVYTLTQFPTVKDVVLGWAQSNQEGEGEIVENLTRESYDFLLPPIVVEEPFDGQRVGRIFSVSGIANVFEANVSYTVTDADDNILDEGFVTATCGSGCYGTYEFEVRLKGDHDIVYLHVFQASAEDGSPMDEEVIPLNVR